MQKNITMAPKPHAYFQHCIAMWVYLPVFIRKHIEIHQSSFQYMSPHRILRKFTKLVKYNAGALLFHI